MRKSTTIRTAAATIAIGFSAAALTVGLGVAVPGAVAAAIEPAGCTIDAVISQDITRSFSDANLDDTKTQIQDAVQSFVGSPYPVTLGITTFGQIAPLATAPALLGIDVTTQAGADELENHVADYEFDPEMSGYTNWQAGLRDAFDKAKEQSADTVVFVTDGVPNAYVNSEGVEVGVGGWGTYDPAAAAAAAVVADEIRAAGMNLETVFMRTDRPGFHGLEDPELPTPDAQVEAAMQQLHAGWTIDQVITIAQLADELRERAAAGCSPALSLTKSHGDVEDVNGNGLVDVGDRVVFVFSGRNEGNLPLAGVKVTDQILADRGIPLMNDGVVGDLALGQSYLVVSAPFTIAEQDLLDCGFRNIATAAGTSIKGPLSIQDDDVVTVDTRAAVSIETTTAPIVDVNNDGVLGNAGDSVSWNVVVTNTGNVTWSGAVVSAELLEHAGLSLTPDRVWDGALAPGGTISFTSAPHTITADERALTATVTVTAPAICGQPLAAKADASFNPVVVPAVTPTPSASPTPSATPTPSSSAAALSPRAFTGNTLSDGGDNWVWMLLLGLGGVSIATVALVSSRRPKRDDAS